MHTPYTKPLITLLSLLIAASSHAEECNDTIADIKLQEVVVTGRAPVREVIPVQTL